MSIQLKEVSKIYGTGEVKTKALEQVSLKMNKGEVLVILGASGSGKSTLLNIMSGLDTASEGHIYFNNQEITQYNEEQLTLFRRENLGFIFQQYNLLQHLTVRENIEIGASLNKKSLDLNEVMQAVGIINQAKKYPHQLSGGEQQRVAIARSVAKNPEILFCDEPTGALDEKTATQVLELLEKMNNLYKTTLVIITHNPEIAQMADRVIHMNSGRIQECLINTDKKKVREIWWA